MNILKRFNLISKLLGADRDAVYQTDEIQDSFVIRLLYFVVSTKKSRLLRENIVVF